MNPTQPKERPILFSGPMVRAILEGRKTQTRRIAKPRFDDKKPCEHWRGVNDDDGATMFRHCPHGSEGMGCPYGLPGDRLWVRETWWRGPSGGYEAYRADCHPEGPDNTAGKWVPSIYMPRWASRITLEIVAVRVERLNDISEEDVIREGLYPNPQFAHANLYTWDGVAGNSTNPRYAYELLWESINGRGSWDLNPWVWVVEFKRV